MDFEIVERKGIGHPDSICDAISEETSRALCAYYQKEFGNVLHHNTDKALLVAGQSEPKFGGGKLTKPIKVTIAGRATAKVGDKKVPVGDIAKEATRDYLKSNIHNTNTDLDFTVLTDIGQGSVDLRDVFGRDGMPKANDTSFGVGFAPFSDTENIVKNTADLLNSANFVKKLPAVGSDVKIMGVRKHNAIDVTCAVAIIDKFVSSLEEYKEVKAKINEAVLNNAKNLTSNKVNVHVNTSDDFEKESVYLTVTGLSAEMGDDGQVGRGNRVNGLITVRRPMSLEAAAGKNPVNHVGKIYNIIGNLISEDIVKKVSGIEEVRVSLLSQIGLPINEPQVCGIEILSKNIDDNMREEASNIAAKWLNNIKKVTDMIIKGEVKVF